jgi:hypothetical protein
MVTITHEGYLEILITALGVLATLTTLAAAILGFIGYQSVKGEAVSASKDAAIKQAEQTAKTEVARLTKAEVHSLAEDAVRRALVARDENLQGAALGQSEAEDVPHRARAADNAAPRPVKRIIRDAEIGEYADDE